MSRVKEGNRRLTCDIPEDLHKELRFLAVENDTSITKYVKALLEEHVKEVRKVKQRRGTSSAKEAPHVELNMDFNYNMGRPQKIGGSYHGSNRKIVNGYREYLDCSF